MYQTWCVDTLPFFPGGYWATYTPRIATVPWSPSRPFPTTGSSDRLTVSEQAWARRNPLAFPLLVKDNVNLFFFLNSYANLVLLNLFDQWL